MIRTHGGLSAASFYLLGGWCRLYLYVCEGYEFKCPSPGHWNIRSKSVCPQVDQYTCLFDVSKGVYVDTCNGPRIEVQGRKTTINNNYLNTEECSIDRFQPIDFSTIGATFCLYQKSHCVEEGQYTIGNETTRSTVKDATCGCDINKGFILISELDQCSCNPSVEDCSCIRQSYLKTGIPNIHLKKCTSVVKPENRDKDQDKITKYRVGSDIIRSGFPRTAAGLVTVLTLLLTILFGVSIRFKTTLIEIPVRYLGLRQRIKQVRDINEKREEHNYKPDLSLQANENSKERTEDEILTENSGYKDDKTGSSEHCAKINDTIGLKDQSEEIFYDAQESIHSWDQDMEENDEQNKGKEDTANFIVKKSKESDADIENDENDHSIGKCELASGKTNLLHENKKTKLDDTSKLPLADPKSINKLITDLNNSKSHEEITDTNLEKGKYDGNREKNTDESFIKKITEDSFIREDTVDSYVEVINDNSVGENTDDSFEKTNKGSSERENADDGSENSDDSGENQINVKSFEIEDFNYSSERKNSSDRREKVSSSSLEKDDSINEKQNAGHGCEETTVESDKTTNTNYIPGEQRMARK